MLHLSIYSSSEMGSSNPLDPSTHDGHLSPDPRIHSRAHRPRSPRTQRNTAGLKTVEVSKVNINVASFFFYIKTEKKKNDIKTSIFGFNPSKCRLSYA